MNGVVSKTQKKVCMRENYFDYALCLLKFSMFAFVVFSFFFVLHANCNMIIATVDFIVNYRPLLFVTGTFRYELDNHPSNY